jgi:magnesium chelatase family protein
MDRIDLVVEVPRPRPELLMSAARGASSAELASRVGEAHARAAARRSPYAARLSGAELLAACRLDGDATRFTERAAAAHHLSGRGITRLLRVARTFADLDGRDRVTTDDLSEGLSYRFKGGR